MAESKPQMKGEREWLRGEGGKIKLLTLDLKEDMLQDSRRDEEDKAFHR